MCCVLQAAAGGEGSSSQQHQVSSVFMSPPFVPAMLDPIVAMFSPHRAQQQKEMKNKVSYAAASRTRLQVCNGSARAQSTAAYELECVAMSHRACLVLISIYAMLRGCALECGV